MTSSNDFSEKLNKLHLEQYNSYLNLPTSLSQYNPPKTTTQLNRFIQNVQFMNALSLFNRTHYITTCFKVHAENTNCIYGYMLSEKNKSKPMFTHSYYIFGPTYTSQDGEYRSRLLPYNIYDMVRRTYPDIFELVEKYVLQLMNEQQINLYCDIFYPGDEVIDESKFRSEVNNTRMAIKLFILCFLTDYYPIINDTQPNHIYPGYEIIFRNLPSGKDIIKKIGELLMKIKPTISYNITLDDRFSRLSRHCVSPHIIMKEGKPLEMFNIQELQIGVKFIPLSVREAQNHGVILYDTWREYYITRRICDLVLNIITPGLPLVSTWFILQNTDANFFDGYAMHQKYEYSKTADNVINTLKNTREMFKRKDVSGKPMKGDNFISLEFKQLSQRILKDIVYTNTHLRLSDFTLCSAGEYIGKTFLDIDKIMKMEEFYHIHNMFSDRKIFDGLLFSFMYTLYSMNSRMYISHNDLHLNNVTLFKYIHIRTSEDDRRNIPIHKNTHTLFYINKDTQYMMPNVGYYIGIIDFSRALIGNHDAIKEFDDVLYRQILKDQRNRFMYVMERKFANLVKDKKDDLESLLLSKLPLMFKILSALDVLDVCLRVKTLLGTVVKNYSPDILKLLESMAMRAEKKVLVGLKRAIIGELTSENDIEYPVWELMEETFPEYKYDAKNKQKYKDIDVVDAYNYENPLKYSMCDPKGSRWPPWVHFDTEKNLLKELKLPEDEYIKAWEEYIKKKDKEIDPFEPLLRKYDDDITDIGNSTQWLV